MIFRLKCSFVLIFLLLSLLCVRIFQLQILDGPSYFKLARKQFLKESKTETFRGTILDRNGNLLATSIPTVSIYIHPKELEKSDRLFGFLSAQLSISAEELKSKIDSLSNFVWLKRKMERPPSKYLLENRIKGLGMVEEQTRYYPNGTLACHLLGAVGIDNQALAGIEYSYDSFLKGQTIENILLRDSRGRKILSFTKETEQINDEADFSKELILTIDRTLQYITEKELERGIQEFKAGSGMSLIQNPVTGEILAMASYPPFDPNLIHQGKYSSEGTPNLIQNPVLGKMFEPGSTFKIVTFAAALEEDRFGLQDRFFCENGNWKVAGRTIQDSAPNEYLNFSQVLEKSSNIGTAKIALSLGKELLYRYARSFGFGTRTGIGLPGETAGKLKAPHLWSAFSPASISFGQEVGVSALQITQAFSAIANGGLLMEPQIVREIRQSHHGKNSIQTFRPEIVRRVISEKTAKLLQTILFRSVESGTGIRARINGYPVAGKTGTAQKIDPQTRHYFKDRHLTSFCGFLPLENPQITCLVILDDVPKDATGGNTAAIIFSRILSQAVKLLGLPTEESDPAIVSNPASTQLKKSSETKKFFSIQL